MSEDLEQRDNRERTPLTRACVEGDLEQVQRLIDKGANVEAKDDNEWTALAFACCKGHESIARLLIDKGAIIEAMSIELAAQTGHAALVELLVRAGVDINDNREEGGSTALIVASGEGHVDVVDCLLSLGADTEVKDWEGTTALMVASGKG